MENIIIINNNSVEFRNKEGQVYVSSRDVAKVFGKRHDNIIRSVEQLPNDDFRQLNFELSKYTKDLQDGSGVHSYKEYLLTRDGFSMLVMGFTGEKAYQWKKDFINAFNQMEQALKNQQPEFKIPTTMVEALELALEQAKEIEKLNSKIEIDKHKVEFYDSVADSKDAITISEAAKVLNMGVGRNKLFEILRNNKILQNNNIPYQQYIDRGYFRVIEQQWIKPDGENCISIKTLVYQTGLNFIRRLLNNNNHKILHIKGIA